MRPTAARWAKTAHTAGPVATHRNDPGPAQAPTPPPAGEGEPSAPEPPRGALTVSAGRGPVGISVAFVIAGALILLAGLALAFASGSGSTPGGPAPAYLYANGWVERPPALAVGANATVSGLRWAGWGAATATGHGTLPLDDCQPTCATGTVKPTPATVIVTRLRDCSSRRVYTHVAVRVEGRTSAALPLGFDFSCS